MSINDEAHNVWVNCHGYVAEVIDCDLRRIRYADHGKLTEFGWEIDHVQPSAWGGLDVYANKRPRHWQGNRRAGAFVSYVNALTGTTTPATPPPGLINSLMKPKPPKGGLF
jgi:hypothetical protein